ncbi:hypothetical protein F5B21DRAFT_495454, partial [Xylaria acuta]
SQQLAQFRLSLTAAVMQARVVTILFLSSKGPLRCPSLAREQLTRRDVVDSCKLCIATRPWLATCMRTPDQS